MTTQNGDSFMVKQILVLMLMGLLLLTGVALGGFGLSENASSESQSISSTDALMAGDSVGSSYVSATSPNVAATGSVDNQAVYSSQAPSQGSLGMLQPVSATTGSTGQIYYNGDYLAWQSFISTFPVISLAYG